MANTAKQGMDMLLFIGEGAEAKAIGGQRNASIEMTSESLDISTKDTGNGWASKMNGALSWTAECDGIYYTGDVGYEAAVDAFLAKQPINVMLANKADKSFGFKGQAIITSLSFDTPYDDAMTYAMSLEGVGELVKIATAGA